MDRTTVLLLAAVAVISMARNVSSLPPPPPTTTTSTTTATPPEVVTEIVTSGPIAHGLNACLRCQARLGPYTTMVMRSDLTAMSAVMDQLCDVDVPMVEQCLRDTDGGRCLAGPTSHLTNTYRFLCRHKADVRNGVDCWSAGYPEVIARCLRSYAASSTLVMCQRGHMLVGCVRSSLQSIPQCSANDISFVVKDYITFSLKSLCGPLLSGL